MAEPPPSAQIEQVPATAIILAQVISPAAVSGLPTANKSKTQKTKELLC